MGWKSISKNLSKHSHTYVQHSSITCFHSSLALSQLTGSEDAAISFSGLSVPKLKTDSFLLRISRSSSTLIRLEKSCSERFWKFWRVPMGLGNVREGRRWQSLTVDQASSSMSESVDIPAELWYLFFGGLSAETYWEKQMRAQISGTFKNNDVCLCTRVGPSLCVCPLW